MHIELPRVLLKRNTKVGEAPRFEIENTKLGAFHFTKVGAEIFFFLEIKSPHFCKMKNKSRGEKGALFLLTRFIIFGIRRLKFKPKTSKIKGRNLVADISFR